MYVMYVMSVMNVKYVCYCCMYVRVECMYVCFFLCVYICPLCTHVCMRGMRVIVVMRAMCVDNVMFAMYVV